MIAKIYRVKNGRIRIEVSDDTLEKTMAKDVSSVSAAKKLMEYLNPSGSCYRKSEYTERKEVNEYE